MINNIVHTSSRTSTYYEYSHIIIFDSSFSFSTSGKAGKSGASMSTASGKAGKYGASMSTTSGKAGKSGTSMSTTSGKAGKSGTSMSMDVEVSQEFSSSKLLFCVSSTSNMNIFLSRPSLSVICSLSL